MGFFAICDDFKKMRFTCLFTGVLKGFLYGPFPQTALCRGPGVSDKGLVDGGAFSPEAGRAVSNVHINTFGDIGSEDIDKNKLCFSRVGHDQQYLHHRQRCRQ